MKISKVIKLAQRGGYNIPTREKCCINLFYNSFIFLDPSFWECLGKGLGNKDEMECGSPKCDTKQCSYAGYKDPKRMFDNFMETIWYGKTPEDFFNTLEDTKNPEK